MRYPGKRPDDLHDVETLWTWIPLKKQNAPSLELVPAPLHPLMPTTNFGSIRRVPREVTADTMSKLSEKTVSQDAFLFRGLKLEG